MFHLDSYTALEGNKKLTLAKELFDIAITVNGEIGLFQSIVKPYYYLLSSPFQGIKAVPSIIPL